MTVLRKRAAAVAVAGLLGLTACTTSNKPQADLSPSRATATHTVAPASTIPSTPVNTGPTTSRDASACPFIDTQDVHSRVGQRLAKVTVQYSAGKAVGCTWYALQKPNDQCGAVCLKGEHLPPADQPDVRISSSTYASADAAHNAVVRLATASTSSNESPLPAVGDVAACFQTRFWYPHDAGQDWACAYAEGGKVVYVQTTDTDDPTDVTTLTPDVAKHF